MSNRVGGCLAANCAILHTPAGATPMSDQKLLSLAAALRARVEEVLTQAETMKDWDTQRKMRGIATTYEKLAQRLEQHADDVDKVLQGPG